MASILRCMVFLAAVLLAGCVFVPKSCDEQGKLTECKMYTPAWQLSAEMLNNLDVCNGSGNDLGACLITVGVIIPVGSFIVSGSIVVVGNTVHWLEYQGRCDEGAVARSVEKLQSGLKGSQNREASDLQP